MGQVHTATRYGAVDRDTGNLVAFWLEYPDRPEYYPNREEAVLVTEPYAVFLTWTDRERRFYIYDNSAKTYFKTSEFKAFLMQLDKLPQGIEIQYFDTCCDGNAWAMPQEKREQLRAVMAQGARGWAPSTAGGFDHEMVCTCETTGLRYP
jgi:hypothetical protein